MKRPVMPKSGDTLSLRSSGAARFVRYDGPLHLIVQRCNVRVPASSPERWGQEERIAASTVALVIPKRVTPQR